jgi:hypothetical protein
MASVVAASPLVAKVSGGQETAPRRCGALSPFGRKTEPHGLHVAMQATVKATRVGRRQSVVVRAQQQTETRRAVLGVVAASGALHSRMRQWKAPFGRVFDAAHEL